MMRRASSAMSLSAVLGFLLCICGLASAETVITLKNAVQVAGSQVRLGDVATIEGVPPAKAKEMAQLAVASAPKPGRSKEIDRDYMLAKLHQQGYPVRQMLFQGPRSSIATRSSQSIDSDTLEAKFRASIESHMPWKTADTVIDIQPPADVLALPTGKIDVRFESGGDYRYLGDETFRTTVAVDGNPCKTLYLRASVHPFECVAVAVRDIKRGDPIQDTDFAMVRKDLADLSGGFFTDQAAIRGLIAARSISAGSAISLRSVDRPVVIKRGKIVTAEVAGRGFRVTAMVKAMDDGRVGDVVRLTNVNSRKTLTGEVADENTVRVAN